MMGTREGIIYSGSSGRGGGISTGLSLDSSFSSFSSFFSLFSKPEFSNYTFLDPFSYASLASSLSSLEIDLDSHPYSDQKEEWGGGDWGSSFGAQSVEVLGLIENLSCSATIFTLFDKSTKLIICGFIPHVSSGGAGFLLRCLFGVIWFGCRLYLLIHTYQLILRNKKNQVKATSMYKWVQTLRVKVRLISRCYKSS